MRMTKHDAMEMLPGHDAAEAVYEAFQMGFLKVQK